MPNPATNAPLLVHFEAGHQGAWATTQAMTHIGESLPSAPRLSIALAPGAGPAFWALRGVVSSLRYTTRAEAVDLLARSEGLGRPEASRAVLIPIRKSPAWWALAQDERRAIYEEQSRHTSIGMKYLPHIARRLHHSRDLGEPFDFLTWFEFAPAHEVAFDALLGELRASKEWTYVDREVEFRFDRT